MDVFLVEIEFPTEQRKLKIMLKTPPQDMILLGTQRPVKMPRALIDIRGPELVHTQLTHKQYGIRVSGGGVVSDSKCWYEINNKFI